MCANRTNPSYSASYDSWDNETTLTYNGTTATLSYDKLDELVQWNAGVGGNPETFNDPTGNDWGGFWNGVVQTAQALEGDASEER